MNDAKSVKPDFSKVEIAAPSSPYDFDNLLAETFTVVKRDGTPIVTITCHEATGKESSALPIITRIESAQCDAYFESKGGKLENLPNGRQAWKFPDGFGLSLEENNFIAFRRRVYPKLAACSTCNLERLPTAEEAWRFPESELEKWYRAALKVNPTWFDEFRQIPRQQIIEEIAKGNGAKKYKKKSRKR